MRNLIKLVTSEIISFLGIQGATANSTAEESLNTASSDAHENMDSNNNKTLVQENDDYHFMAVCIFCAATLFGFLYSFYISVGSKFKKF